MALGGEVNSMRKQAEEWRKSPGPWRPGLIAFILIAIGLGCLKVAIHDEQKQPSTEATPPSTAEETFVPTRGYEVEVDENGIPTPESLERIEASQAMEEYYREQMDEAQKQMMQEPESDGFEGQPY